MQKLYYEKCAYRIYNHIPTYKVNGLNGKIQRNIVRFYQKLQMIIFHREKPNHTIMSRILPTSLNSTTLKTKVMYPRLAIGVNDRQSILPKTSMFGLFLLKNLQSYWPGTDWVRVCPWEWSPQLQDLDFWVLVSLLWFWHFCQRRRQQNGDRCFVS